MSFLTSLVVLFAVLTALLFPFPFLAPPKAPTPIKSHYQSKLMFLKALRPSGVITLDDFGFKTENVNKTTHYDQSDQMFSQGLFRRAAKW
jgi:hypothetical protein